jgi:hypothetical protein
MNVRHCVQRDAFSASTIMHRGAHLHHEMCDYSVLRVQDVHLECQGLSGQVPPKSNISFEVNVRLCFCILGQLTTFVLHLYARTMRSLIFLYLFIQIASHIYSHCQSNIADTLTSTSPD